MTPANARLVVVFVGLTFFCSVVGIVALAFTGNSTPDVLQNVAIGSMTGLLGLLIPSQQE